MAYPTQAPFGLYADRNGNPLDGGYLYFGVAGQNPQSNPVSIYWDLAATIPAAQPVRTVGGYTYRNGTPATVYVAGDYSITVRDSNGTLVYSILDAADISPIAALADTSDVALGDALVGFKQSNSSGALTGAVGSTVHKKLQEIVSVKDFGALGNGVADDTSAIQACLDAVAPLMNGTGTSTTVLFPSGKYIISSTITVPPCVILEGDGAFGVTNLTTGQGSIISQTHNGAGVRFTRTNGSPGSLWHNGGARNLTFSGPGAGTSVHLIELGDASNVDTTHGAWCGFIHDCEFNYATTGYGIYSAHSQLWDIRNNVFSSVKYGIYYNTVIAGCLIDHNTFDNSALAMGSAGCAIFGRPGTLGGAAGIGITNNYIISHDEGIHLTSIIGAKLSGNQYEGIYTTSLYFSKYLLDEVTADGDGCVACNFSGETFINWSANAVTPYPAVNIAYSAGCYAGVSAYQSPNGIASAAVTIFDFTSINNTIYYPIVTGINAAIVPGMPSNIGVLANTNNIISTYNTGKALYQVVDVGSVAYGSLGTSTTPVSGTIYISEIEIPRAITLTGIAPLNAGTVGTNKWIVALYNSSGTLLANSSLSGATTSGANSFQQVNFTAQRTVVPGRYWIAVQLDGTTDRFRTIAASTYLGVYTASQVGVFGTIPATITPPTSFAADSGPFAYVI